MGHTGALSRLMGDLRKDKKAMKEVEQLKEMLKRDTWPQKDPKKMANISNVFKGVPGDGKFSFASEYLPLTSYNTVNKDGNPRNGLRDSPPT